MTATRLDIASIQLLREAFDLDDSQIEGWAIGEWAMLRDRVTAEEPAPEDLPAALRYARSRALQYAASRLSLAPETPLPQSDPTQPRVWMGKRIKVDHWCWRTNSTWQFYSAAHARLLNCEIFILGTRHEKPEIDPRDLPSIPVCRTLDPQPAESPVDPNGQWVIRFRESFYLEPGEGVTDVFSEAHIYTRVEAEDTRMHDAEIVSLHEAKERWG